MNLARSIFTTIAFELSRMLTPRRMSLALVMILFPPGMMAILVQTGLLLSTEMTICIFCGMTCLLSLLLWATPNVYAELEGRSWTFVTTRPWGRWSVLFGKYLIAVIWSFGVSWIAMSLCMLMIDSQNFPSLTDQIRQRVDGVRPPPLTWIQLWVSLSLLLLLASCVYAAVFSFLGVIIQRRAMVVAVGYFLIFEIMLALVPAVVGKLAMTYHLLCLLFNWVGMILPTGSDGADFAFNEFENLYGLYPSWVHLVAILATTIIMLVVSAWVIRCREYITLEDAQV